ncbi:hypothetical protein SYNTR_1168 [Candidatus Syntrophocurvum alkaliphilum]|uniref:Uncharacterized protein n=1 Tax=Candidatus Syntrophocurvum alkaliphilum TaxID=2293317 RepID=A0A6I6DKB3_9FIRM|nr:hypothetical protein SYNTR_1168 [Candidatus Syntrophocurvum alkaliphilum]
MFAQPIPYSKFSFLQWNHNLKNKKGGIVMLLEVLGFCVFVAFVLIVNNILFKED